MIVSVDPGLTTGLAWWDPSEMKHPLTREVADDPMYAVRCAMRLGPEMIAVENFTPRGGVRTWQPDALHIIGALKYQCWLRDRDFVLQSPADAKRFATNEKLERAGWRQRGQTDHELDALRHMLLLTVRLGITKP